MNITMEMIDQLVASGELEFSLEVEPDDVDYHDELEFKKDIKWVEKQLAAGNEWAWCQVKVTAMFQGMLGFAYLSGCMYYSEDDFKAPGNPYSDMQWEAFNDLITKAEKSAKLLDSLRELVSHES